MEEISNNINFSNLNIDLQINLIENNYKIYLEPEIIKSFDTIINYSSDNKLLDKALHLGEIII